jgi:ketosteroid isomerase-like protein
MKKLSGWRKSAIFLCVLPLLAAPVVSVAQSAPAKSAAAPDPLFQTVSALDTKLFDAYNHCDLDTLGTLVTDDLEFYHDKTGLSVGKQVFLDAIKQNICGKVHRTLVPGTLEVYPLNGYGAVEIGIHRFTHPRLDNELGEAKFITIWQNKDGSWKVARVISYDHEPVRK